jgi:hypothetical protein
MRDHPYETRWLDELAAAVEHRHGVNVQVFVHAVRERLALGTARYGDDAFLRKDVVAEALEETPDVAAYVLLEVQKRLAGTVEADGRVTEHLFTAAIHAAVADHHLRQVALIDRGVA